MTPQAGIGLALAEISTVITPARPRFRVLSTMLLSILVLIGAIVDASPAAAAQTQVGPCTFDIDYPHVSSTASLPTIRVHVRYKCSSSVLYVNTHITLYRCDQPGQDPLTCVVAGTGEGAHGTTDVNYSDTWKILAVADSDAYPSSGWYVAKSSYEVCIFNGDATYGFGQSDYVQYDATRTKTGEVFKVVRDINPTA